MKGFLRLWNPRFARGKDKRVRPGPSSLVPIAHYFYPGKINDFGPR
jgi:hypothetical protein